jgi:hypothetical protein
VTADNASSNNVQAAALYELENAFDEANHIRCFNHTIQLSGKALIKPFNAGMGKADSSLENGDDDVPNMEDFDDDAEDDADPGVLSDDGDEEEDDEGEILSEEERLRILDDTSAVRETVSKVCFMFYFRLSNFSGMPFHSFDSFRLRSFIQLLSHFQHGDDSARSMN